MFLARKVGAPEMESWLAFTDSSWVLLISHRSYLVKFQIRDVNVEALSKNVASPGIRTIEPDVAWFEFWVFILSTKRLKGYHFPPHCLPTLPLNWFLSRDAMVIAKYAMQI